MWKEDHFCSSVVEVLPCSGCFITCMRADFPEVQLDNAIRFSTFPWCQGFCGIVYLLIIYSLKLYLPLVHKTAFAIKFQLYNKIKWNTYYISLHIKDPQSISPIFLILFLNSNYESLDFTAAGRLFDMREPEKWTAFVP